MLRLTVQLGDTVIAADAAADAPKIGMWHVLLQDGCSGRYHPCTLTNVQLGAVLALAIGLGEDYSEPASMGVQWLYNIAQEALTAADCPQECWPIP